MDGLSNRQIARSLSCSEWLVRSRIVKMSQQALLFQTKATKDLRIKEPIAFDGLENFARSQYEPNNLNHAIGRDSYFIYDFNFAPLNRKGRMSDRQKLKNDKLQVSLGRVPKTAIKISSLALFKRLLERRDEKEERITLLTDQHFLYRKALHSLGTKAHLIEHQSVSSKASRTYKNILFPVNHTDLLTRQHVKAFARETISFSKTEGAMVQKYALFMVWKNFLRPQFTKSHKLDPKSNSETPAQKLNLTNRILKFGDVFQRKLFKNHTPLNQDWALFFLAKTPFKRTGGSLLTAHN